MLISTHCLGEHQLKSLLLLSSLQLYGNAKRRHYSNVHIRAGLVAIQMCGAVEGYYIYGASATERECKIFPVPDSYLVTIRPKRVKAQNPNPPPQTRDHVHRPYLPRVAIV